MRWQWIIGVMVVINLIGMSIAAYVILKRK
jgi:hypothetical protein